MRFLASEGWRKVEEHGSSYVIATLYNIVTGEVVGVSVRDYDRSDIGECEAPEWYDVAIDAEARHAWLRLNGVISAGDRAVVVAGRKIEHGFVGVVEKIRPVRDRYGRHVADYAVFTDGRATNVDNCVLVM